MGEATDTEAMVAATIKAVKELENCMLILDMGRYVEVVVVDWVMIILRRQSCYIYENRQSRAPMTKA